MWNLVFIRVNPRKSVLKYVLVIWAVQLNYIIRNDNASEKVRYLLHAFCRKHQFSEQMFLMRSRESRNARFTCRKE